MGKAAKFQFFRFLDGNTYTADQINFITHIIDHLSHNGTIDKQLLYQEPFSDIHFLGVNGLFKQHEINAIFRIIDTFNTIIE